MQVNLDNDFFDQVSEVDAIIRDYWLIIDTYSINADNSVNVVGNVKFPDSVDFLTELPLKFNIVTGNFDCSRLKLKTLKGSPVQVGGTFNCAYNELLSLEFLPKKAGCFVFDNTVQSLYAGDLSCNFDQVVLICITDNPSQIFLKEIDSKELNVFFKLQTFYDVWNDDKTLNKVACAGFFKDINEGLE